MVGLATQAFGHLTPAHALLFDQSDDGTAAIRAPYDRAAMADGILRAVASTTPADSFHEEYLALGPGNAIEIFYPDAWFHAVNGSTTDTVMDRMAPMRTRVESPARAGRVLDSLLSADETLRILTPPQAVRPLRRDLSTARVEPLLASRNSGR
jgi:hypothetical protein